MKLDEFLKLYDEKENDPFEQHNLIREHINDAYVNYEVKGNVAKAIADTCNYERHEGGESGGEKPRFHIDSVARYMLTKIAMFDLYTDIQRDSNNNILNDFNALNKRDIFGVIEETVDPREMHEFIRVIDMACEDAIANEYEPHAFIRNQVERFADILGATLTPLLESLDAEKIESLISKLNNS